MRYSELIKIKKFVITPDDVADALNISKGSAAVTCSRYAAKGMLTRVKRNYYVISQEWPHLTDAQVYSLANIIQIPSYVSLTTALSYYNVSTQIQRKYCESISVKRTKEHAVKDAVFSYTKIDKKLYGHFSRKEGFFIASPEKALLDAVYLASINRYSVDLDALDFKKLDLTNIKTILEAFPEKTKTYWRNNVEPFTTRRT